MRVDKSVWGPGLWNEEPDQVEWNYEGFDCLMRRHMDHGHWCGYVRVPENHILFQVDHHDSTMPTFNVHGGVTFSGYGQGPIRFRYWMIGFDCAHFSLGDFAPGLEQRGMYDHEEDERCYRDLLYVQREVEGLVEQLREVRYKRQ